MEKPATTSSYFWLPLFFLVVLILGMFIGVKLEMEGVFVTQTNVTEKYPKKIDALFRLLDAKYMEEVDYHQLLQQTIDLLKATPFDTTYTPSKRLQRINEQVDIKPYGR